MSAPETPRQVSSSLSRWVLWSVAIAAVGGVVAGIVLSKIDKPSAQVVIVDWRALGDSSERPGSATIQVTNQGTATAQVCVAHWVTASGLDLGSSSEFGLAPQDKETISVNRSVAQSPAAVPSLFTYDQQATTVYVQCGDTRFPDAPDITVPVQGE